MPSTTGMTYRAQIARVAGTKVYVHNVKGLGGLGDEFGPLNVILPMPAAKTLTTSSASSPDAHTHTVDIDGYDLSDYYVKGDWVVVTQIGHVKEDLIVLGKLA